MVMDHEWLTRVSEGAAASKSNAVTVSTQTIMALVSLSLRDVSGPQESY